VVTVVDVHRPDGDTSFQEVSAMSVATSFDLRAGAIPSATTGQVVASYSTYEEAQRAIDHLSDSAFPVEHSAIVGRDLRLVERVLGRLTRTRATLMGAASGAWFGLFVGTLITLFVIGPEWIAITLTAVAIGALSGAIFGFAAHWATHGQRDFASASAVVAGQHDVTVTDAYSERAAQLISSLG
jgi:hypothetical protein